MSYHTEVDRWCIKQFWDRDCGYKSVFTGWKAIRQQGNALSSSSPWESELEGIKCNVSIAGSSIILLMRWRDRVRGLVGTFVITGRSKLLHIGHCEDMKAKRTWFVLCWDVRSVGLYHMGIRDVRRIIVGWWRNEDKVRVEAKLEEMRRVYGEVEISYIKWFELSIIEAEANWDDETHRRIRFSFTVEEKLDQYDDESAFKSHIYSYASRYIMASKLCFSGSLARSCTLAPVDHPA